MERRILQIKPMTPVSLLSEGDLSLMTGIMRVREMSELHLLANYMVRDQDVDTRKMK